MAGLFRDEAIAAASRRQIGPVSVYTPRWLSASMTAAILATVALLVGAVVGTYSPKTLVQGLVVPQGGVVEIHGPPGSTVVRVLVAEGSTVRRGDPLLEVASDRTTMMRSEAGAAIRALLSERRTTLHADLATDLERADDVEQALKRRLASLEEERNELFAEVATQERRLGVLEEARLRYERLREENFISAAALKDRQLELLAQQSGLQAARRMVLSNQRELDATALELRELPRKRANLQAANRRSIALVDQEGIESHAKSALQVTSSITGTVTALATVPGQTVTEGTALLSVVPSGSPMEVHLFAGTKAVGLVEVGQRVRLRFLAFPVHRTGYVVGRVSAVSQSPVRRDSATGAMASDQDQQYRITVTLPSQTITVGETQRPPMPGTKVEGHILGEARPIGAWLLETMRLGSTR